MNAAREDANVRDMFRARREETRVERGFGSDGLRDGGYGRTGAGAPCSAKCARIEFATLAESAPRSDTDREGSVIENFDF